MFTELEENGSLNPSNEVDLYALHFTFIPRVNESLANFVLAWNNHPLSTENNLSPLQIYTAYLIGSALFEEDVDPATYGTEDISLGADSDEEDQVQVPNIIIPLTELRENDPLANSQDHGKLKRILQHCWCSISPNDK